MHEVMKFLHRRANQKSKALRSFFLLECAVEKGWFAYQLADFIHVPKLGAKGIEDWYMGTEPSLNGACEIIRMHHPFTGKQLRVPNLLMLRCEMTEVTQ